MDRRSLIMTISLSVVGGLIVIFIGLYLLLWTKARRYSNKLRRIDSNNQSASSSTMKVRR